MQLNIDTSCSDSNSIVKELIEDLLSLIDNSESKRKDNIRSKLKKKDETQLKLLDNLIKRKAIICSSEKFSKHSRVVLSTANRKYIYYAINKNIDVPEEDYIKKAFFYWYSLKQETSKSSLSSFNYLKEGDVNDMFKLYNDLPLLKFSQVTDYITSIYEEHLKSVNRSPVPNPYADKYKNIIINKDEAEKLYQEKKEEEECLDVCDIEILDDVDSDNKTTQTNITNDSENSTISEKKCNHLNYNTTRHLIDIQNELFEIIKKLDIKLKSISVRDRCYRTLKKEEQTSNVLLAKLMFDVNDIEIINYFATSIENISKAINVIKKNISDPLSQEDINIINNIANFKDEEK